MAFLIKLVYTDEIRHEIFQGGHHKNADATKLDETVNTIFTNNHWEPGCWTSAKKGAIKDILKEVLVEQRAQAFPDLIARAQTLMRSHRITLPLTADDSALLSQKLHESNPIFSPKEIHYLLRNFSAVGRLYVNKGLLQADENNTMSPTGTANTKSLEKNFLKVHNSAIEDYQNTKEYFNTLTSLVSDKTGISEAAIHREIYKSIFHTKPQGLSNQEVLKRLQDVAPDRRLKAYRKMTGFIRLTQMAKSLSDKEVAAFIEISKGRVPQDLKGPTLDRFSFLLEHLSMLQEGDVDNPFYARMEKNFKEAWTTKFADNSPIGKALKAYNDPDDAQRLEFRVFKEMLGQINRGFNMSATNWIKKQLQSANLLASPLNQISRYIYKKLDFSSATLQHIYSAINVNQFGVSKVTNFNELIPALFNISTLSAKKIRDFLLNPNSDHNLTFHEQKHLLLLYTFAKEMTGAGTPVDAEDINFDGLRNYLPKRGQAGTAIDEAILLNLYAIIDNTDLFLALYQNAVSYGFRSYTARANPEELASLVQSDIAHPSIDTLDLPDGSSLPMTEAFKTDNNRNPDVIIQLPGNQRPVVIPAYDDEIRIPAELQGDSYQLTVPQALGHYLHRFAKEDPELSLILQSLCSQTVFNHLYFNAVTRHLNNLLHLPETDTSINRFMVAPQVSSRSIKYLESTHIRIEYKADLLFRDTNQSPPLETTVPLTLSIDLMNEQGGWVVRNPMFVITKQHSEEHHEQILVLDDDSSEGSRLDLLSVMPIPANRYEEPTVTLKVATRNQLKSLIEMRNTMADLKGDEAKHLELSANYNRLILTEMGKDFQQLLSRKVEEVSSETDLIILEDFDTTSQAVSNDLELTALVRILKDPNIRFADDEDIHF
ncbi:MAG: hypothetical protein JSR57_08780 [Verrucomicrobia bacterium]|nr:hypothetical protein [Verrucomicrobiota bacterium]